MFNLKQRILTNVSAVGFVLATVGTGFGQWFFTSGSSTMNLNTAVELTDAISYNDISSELVNSQLSIDKDGNLTNNTCQLMITTNIDFVKSTLIGDSVTSSTGDIVSITLAYLVNYSFINNWGNYLSLDSITGGVKEGASYKVSTTITMEEISQQYDIENESSISMPVISYFDVTFSLKNNPSMDTLRSLNTDAINFDVSLDETNSSLNF